VPSRKTALFLCWPKLRRNEYVNQQGNRPICLVFRLNVSVCAILWRETPFFTNRHQDIPNSEKEALVLSSSHSEKKAKHTLRARAAAAAAENVQERHCCDYHRYDILRMLGRRGLSPWRQHAVVLLSCWTRWTGRNAEPVVVRAAAVVAEQEASTTTTIPSIEHPRVLQSVTEQRKQEYIDLALAKYPPIMVRFVARCVLHSSSAMVAHNTMLSSAARVFTLL
jgi:hypothetical protein